MIAQIIYMALGIVLAYFLMDMFTSNKSAVSSDGTVDLDNKNEKEKAQQDVEQYAQQLLTKTNLNSQEIQNKIKQYKFKKEKPKLDQERLKKEGIMNKLLNMVSQISGAVSKAPELENYDDYAPASLPMDTAMAHSEPRKPILPNNKTVPNYLELQRNGSVPLPVNEFDTDRPANFMSERRNAWHDKMSSDDLANFFKNNPHKFFDGIGKADVQDPSQWEKISKRQEERSPLLNQPSMKTKDKKYMPSNHFDIDKAFQPLNH